MSSTGMSQRMAWVDLEMTGLDIEKDKIIDVSTIKELCRRWFPDDYQVVPHKKATHRALEDITESIKELQYYRANVFKASTEEKKRKIIENGGSNKCPDF